MDQTPGEGYSLFLPGSQAWGRAGSTLALGQAGLEGTENRPSKWKRRPIHIDLSLKKHLAKHLLCLGKQQAW